MDNEKYGIELELITNKFKQKMQEIKNAFKGVDDKKININANTEFLKRDLEIASNQVEYLRDKLARLKTQQKGLFDYQKDTDKGRMLANEIQNVSLQLEKAGLNADKLADRLNKAENEGQQISRTFRKSNNISSGIERMTSKIKRFGLALLSIRSIFSLVSRASSAYLAQDTELANKLQSVWAGLGSLLAPIIEAIANILMKAVAYINIFIKALTGVDLLARASAKSMKGAAGAAKSLNKALAGFDELNNLDTDAGGGTGGFGGALSDFENLELPWADKIKEFGEWIRDNKELVLGFLAGLATALLGLKTHSKILIGLGLVITGISIMYGGFDRMLKGDLSPTNLLKTLFGAAVTSVGAGLLFGNPVGLTVMAVLTLLTMIVYSFTALDDTMKKYAKENGMDYENKTFIEKLELQWEASKEVMGLKEATTEYTRQMKDIWFVTSWVGDAWNWVKEQAQGTWDNMKEFANWVGGIFTSIWERLKYEFNTAVDWIEKQQEGMQNNIIETWEGIKEFIGSAWDWIKGQAEGTWENMKKFGEWIGSVFTGLWNGIKDAAGRAWNWIGDQLQGTKTNFLNFINTIGGWFSSLWNSIKKGFAKVWNGIADVANKAGGALGLAKLPKINSYAVGTNYVPEDQLAFIHKGEAVVPKKYNNGGYVPQSNDETNYLLEQVINAINNIEINPYTTVKDVGKASLSYINNKSRQLGESVVV